MAATFPCGCLSVGSIVVILVSFLDLTLAENIKADSPTIEVGGVYAINGLIRFKCLSRNGNPAASLSWSFNKGQSTAIFLTMDTTTEDGANFTSDSTNEIITTKTVISVVTFNITQSLVGTTIFCHANQTSFPSRTVDFTLNPPTTVSGTGPTGISINAAQTYNSINDVPQTVTCSATCTPNACQFQWTNSAGQVLAATASLSKTAMTSGNSYTCTASNTVTGTSATRSFSIVAGLSGPTSVTLFPSASVYNTPFFLPSSGVQCIAVGCSPTACSSYLWKIQRLGSTQNLISASTLPKSSVTTAGKYTCDVTNGVTLSASFDVSFSRMVFSGSDIGITYNFVSDISWTSNVCQVECLTSCSVIWSRSGVTVSSTGTLLKSQITASGTYTCTASLADGSGRTMNASFTVNAITAITGPGVVSLSPNIQTYASTGDVTSPITCSAACQPSACTYQWIHPDGSFLQTAGSATLSSGSVNSAGVYTCIATNPSNTGSTSQATFTVNARISFTPSTLQYSDPSTVTTSIICNAVCYPSTCSSITWVKGGVQISSTATLTPSQVSTYGAGTYTCQTDNGATSSISVLSSGTGPLSVTISGPDSYNSVSDITGQIECTATCTPNVCQFSWRNSAGTVLSSSSILPLASITRADIYTCTATNTNTNVAMENFFTIYSYLALQPSQQVYSTTAAVPSTGVTCLFDCTGGTCGTVQWRKDGSTISSTASLTKATVTSLGAGMYSCVVTHSRGFQATSSFNVTSSGPSSSVTFTPSTTSYSSVANVNSDVTCGATCSPNPCTFSWTLPDGSTLDQPVLPQSRIDQSGAYTCTATNPTAGSSSSVTKTFNVFSTTTPSTPSQCTTNTCPCTVQSSSGNLNVTTVKSCDTVSYGSSIILACLVEYFPRLNNLTWSFNGVDLQTSDFSTSRLIPGDRFTPNLTISAATYTDAGAWRCRARDSNGVSVTSQPIQLYVSGGYAPNSVIVTGGTSFSVPESSSAQFSTCAANGSPTPSIKWYRVVNGVQSGQLVYEGATLSSTNVPRSLSGTFVCVAGNSEGTLAANQFITIDVLYAPEVISTYKTQNKDVTTDGDGNADLLCELDANPAVQSYVWYDGSGNLISGENSQTLTVSIADTTEYSCGGSNNQGVTTGANRMTFLVALPSDDGGRSQGLAGAATEDSGLSIGELAAIIIGIIFLILLIIIIIICCCGYGLCAKWCGRKEKKSTVTPSLPPVAPAYVPRSITSAVSRGDVDVNVEKHDVYTETEYEVPRYTTPRFHLKPATDGGPIFSMYDNESGSNRPLQLPSLDTQYLYDVADPPKKRHHRRKKRSRHHHKSESPRKYTEYVEEEVITTRYDEDDDLVVVPGPPRANDDYEA